MYKKPVLFQTEDLTEGIYAASGSSSGSGNEADFTPGSFQPYWAGNPKSGSINYAVTLPPAYIGKHIILTFSFEKEITNCFGMGGGQLVSGKSATLNVPGAQNGSVTVQSNEGDPGLKSISIREA